MTQPTNHDGPEGAYPPPPVAWVAGPTPQPPAWGATQPLPPAQGPPMAGPQPPSGSAPVWSVAAPVTEVALNQQGTVVRRRGIGRFAPLAIGSVLVLGGAGFVVTNMADSAGAKNSPEQAVEQLFAALDKEDVIGMLESVTPAERDALMDPVTTMRDHLVRLGVASDELNLHDVKGFDFQVEDLKVRSTPLSENVAMVEATSGRITSIARPRELPAGSTVTKMLDENDESLADAEDNIETTELSAGDGMRLMVVKRNGRWGISLGYSVFELARRDGGKPLPAFGSGEIPALGADTPEAAVEGLTDAFAQGDLKAIIGHLDPLEAAAAYDYVPLYLKDAKAPMRDLDAAVKSLSLDTASTGKGDRRTVTIKGFKAVLQSDGDQTSVDWDGRCMTVKAPDQAVEKTCTDSQELNDFSALQELFGKDLLASMGVAVHQVDGKWYVSPTRTVLDNVNVYLGAVNDDALERLPEVISSMMFGFGGYDDDYDYESPDDSWDEEEDPASAQTDECYDNRGKLIDCPDAATPVRPAPAPAPTTTQRKGF